MKSRLIRLASSLSVGDPNRALMMKRVGHVIEDEDFGNHWESNINGRIFRASRIKDTSELWDSNPNGVYVTFKSGGREMEWILSKAEFEVFKKEMKAMLAFIDSYQSY